jgi:hypothetical protein
MILTTVADSSGNEDQCTVVDLQEQDKIIMPLGSHIITENQETIKDLACHQEDMEAHLVTELNHT